MVLGHAVRPLGAGDGRADVHAGPECAVALVGPARLGGVAVGVGGAAALGLAAAGQLVLHLPGAAGADGQAAAEEVNEQLIKVNKTADGNLLTCAARTSRPRGTT